MEIFKKILVVDDEEDFVFFVKKNLEATGEYKVFVANCGEDGIRLAKIEHPDVILLDVMMPSLGGPDVADLLQADSKTKNIPVVFLTAIVTKEEIGVETIRNIGGQNYVAKPISVKDLIGCIKKVIK